jgi:hypothetical protein
LQGTDELMCVTRIATKQVAFKVAIVDQNRHGDLLEIPYKPTT